MKGLIKKRKNILDISVCQTENREFWRFIDFKNDIHVVFKEVKINRND